MLNIGHSLIIYL